MDLYPTNPIFFPHSKLEPLSIPNAKLLILGTISGRRAIEKDEYFYGSGNQFWHILFSCFNIEYSDNYEYKIQLLQIKRIALWDITQLMYNPLLPGSLKFNDVIGFINEHLEIRCILFNGCKAAELYEWHIGNLSDINHKILPSTSSLNKNMTFEEKTYIWKETLIQYL